jgi:CYTH domain-containing protein
MSVREKSDQPKLQLHHRPVEIERKFLVSNDDWRRLAVRSVRLRDGLIAAYKDRKVRVRIAGDAIATVAIKGPRIGIAENQYACACLKRLSRELIPRRSVRLLVIF